MATLMVVIGAVQRAPAGVTLVTTAAALAPDDSIDWGQLGPDSTILPSTASVTSANGLAATLATGDPTGFVRVDEGASWTGDFAVGSR